ncbi:MAG: CHRD domain-containing protein [Deinococcales bacterium]
MSPHHVVPPVTSPASGFAVAVLDGHQLDVTGAFHGLSSPVPSGGGAHVHRGAAGANGPALHALSVDGTITGTFHDTFQLTSSQLTALENGDLYVQIHSEQHQPGVLRAQLTRYRVTG